MYLFTAGSAWTDFTLHLQLCELLQPLCSHGFVFTALPLPQNCFHFSSGDLSPHSQAVNSPSTLVCGEHSLDSLDSCPVLSLKRATALALIFYSEMSCSCFIFSLSMLLEALGGELLMHTPKALFERLEL